MAVDEPERLLAVSIAAFNDTLRAVSTEGYPHLLCNYLYVLATQFTRFYELCPILSSAGEIRERRLVLAHQTGCTLKAGLALLGIDVPNRM